MPNPERAQGVRRTEIRKLGKKGVGAWAPAAPLAPARADCAPHGYRRPARGFALLI